jgi:sugar/nucleoside kinase (ribokinase family)
MRIDFLITRDGQAHIGLAGGNALYAAVGAALWSDRVAPWARVGENYPAEPLSQLERYHFNISGLKRIAGDHDHRTFYAYTPDGRREDTDPAFHFARISAPMPGALADYVHSTPGQAELSQFEPLALRYDDWPASFAGVRAIHLAPSPIHSHQDLVVRISERGKRIVTLDPGERYMVPELASSVRELLPHVDAFLPSESEIKSLFGPEVSLRAAIKTLGDWGAPLVIIKRGRNGVLLYDHESGNQWRQPAYHPATDKRVIDVTGAGDAFCGGFLVGLATTGRPEVAARMGVVSASLVIEGYGALYAMNAPKETAGNRLRNLEKGFAMP